MDAFVGSVNLTSHLYKPPASYNVDFDQYVLTYLDSKREVKTEYRIDIVELGITDYKMTTYSGDTKLVGRYSRFEIMENIAIPYKIEVTNVEENQKVIIEYRFKNTIIKDFESVKREKNETSNSLKDYISKMNDAYPFKRISAPKHLIDRWNEEVGSKTGQEITEMAFTIDKNAEINDDEIWKMMTYTATMAEKESNPPDTGLEKKKLI